MSAWPIATVLPASAATPAAAPAAANDDTAAGAFARLVATLRAGPANLGEPPAPNDPARLAEQWLEGDAQPEALWAAIWFPPAAAPAEGRAKPPPAAPTADLARAAATPLAAPADASHAPALPAPLHATALAVPVLPPSPPVAAPVPAPLMARAVSEAGPGAVAVATPAAVDPLAPLPIEPAAVRTTGRDAAPAEVGRVDPTPPSASTERSADQPRTPDPALAVAALLPAALATAATPAAIPAAPSFLPGQPVIDLRSPRAPQQIAEQVLWTLDATPDGGVGEVTLRLHPPEMGALEVRLRLDADRVQLQFQVADTGVRDAVQTSLPNLAAMLAARGLSLDQAQVFAPSRPPSRPRPDGSGAGPRTDALAAPRAGSRGLQRLGVIDDFV